jgi:hypothetical protein
MFKGAHLSSGKLTPWPVRHWLHCCYNIQIRNLKFVSITHLESVCSVSIHSITYKLLWPDSTVTIMKRGSSGINTKQGLITILGENPYNKRNSH